MENTKNLDLWLLVAYRPYADPTEDVVRIVFNDDFIDEIVADTLRADPNIMSIRTECWHKGNGEEAVYLDGELWEREVFEL